MWPHLGLQGELERELMPRDELALADVDVSLTVELVEGGGAEGEAALRRIGRRDQRGARYLEQQYKNMHIFT